MMRSVLAFALGGCFTKPDPGVCVPSQPSSPGMTLNETRDEITIRPGMTLSFADESSTVWFRQGLAATETVTITPEC